MEMFLNRPSLLFMLKKWGGGRFSKWRLGVDVISAAADRAGLCLCGGFCHQLVLSFQRSLCFLWPLHAFPCKCFSVYQSVRRPVFLPWIGHCPAAADSFVMRVSFVYSRVMISLLLCYVPFLFVSWAYLPLSLPFRSHSAFFVYVFSVLIETGPVQ